MSGQSTTDIVSKLWNLCHVLRDGGVKYTAYVTELTYLLFLKMAQETGAESAIPEKWRWEKLEKLEEGEKFKHYRRLLIELPDPDTGASKLAQEIFSNAATCITKPRILKKIVDTIDKIDWYSAREEGLGDLYEGLLEKNATEAKSGAGQYFTPRPLIDSMVALMKPSFGDTIQDPASGTGGFLIAARKWMTEHGEIFDLNEKEQDKFYRRTFYGMEIVPETHRLALMNLMLHDIDSSDDGGGIHYGDALSSDAKILPQATLILTNPPFGTKQGGGLPSRNDFTGGRAAVVLPDNVLFEGNVGRQIRKDLMNKCNLHTILRLPNGIFYAKSAKTNVLFFTRGYHDEGNTDQVWVYDLRANMPKFGKRTPLTRQHFSEFEAAYGSDPYGKADRTASGPDGRWQCFSRDEIATRDFSLDLAWLRDESADDAEDLPEPELLAQEAMDELEEAVGLLGQLIKEISFEAETK